jgi:hypothetical protein
MDMDTVMATRWDIIITARRPDGITDARSAGAAWAARPACGSRVAADTPDQLNMRVAPKRGGAVQISNRSARDPLTLAILATRA